MRFPIFRLKKVLSIQIALLLKRTDTLGGGIIHIGYLPHMDATIKLDRSELRKEIIYCVQKWFNCGFIHLHHYIPFQLC